ncbi:MAG TPA: phosphotransferase family protein, partial [Casimicrobiaceae bacterium]|nr:phosphotransferase family protein [Casimicrobiaceae bacterium]
LPSESEYVAEYRRRVGRRSVEPAEWEFYIAYNMFRAAGIAQGIMGRARDGTAASAHALEAGRSARDMAERGWRQVEKLLARR